MIEGSFGADEAWDFVLAHVGIDFRDQLTQDDGDVVVRCEVTGSAVRASGRVSASRSPTAPSRPRPRP